MTLKKRKIPGGTNDDGAMTNPSQWCQWSLIERLATEIVRGLGGGKYSPPKAGCALNGFKSFFDFVNSCGL